MKFSTLMIAAAIVAFTPIASNAGVSKAGATSYAGRPGNICSLATMGLPIPCRPR